MPLNTHKALPSAFAVFLCLPPPADGAALLPALRWSGGADLFASRNRTLPTGTGGDTDFDESETSGGDEALNTR